MIRKIALSAILFLLSGTAANAVMVCEMSATNIDFGDVSVVVLTPGVTSVGSLVISCTGTGSEDYSIALGTGTSNSFADRTMIGSDGSRLSYNLYSQPNLSRIWGDGTLGTTLVTGTVRFGNNTTSIFTVPVYAKLGSRGANPAAGIYVDVVAASFRYNGPNPTTEFQVTARVPSQCLISATNLTFGTYAQAQLDGQSQIRLSCTEFTPWNVGLDGGRFAGGSVSRRSMSGPGPSQLDYQLYSDPARTAVWGNTVGSDTVSGIANGFTQPLDVYGRIPAGQNNIRDGGYTDTITATVTF